MASVLGESRGAHLQDFENPAPVFVQSDFFHQFSSHAQRQWKALAEPHHRPGLGRHRRCSIRASSGQKHPNGLVLRR